MSFRITKQVFMEIELMRSSWLFVQKLSRSGSQDFILSDMSLIFLLAEKDTYKVH